MVGCRKAVLAAAVSPEEQKHDPDVFLLCCRGYAEGQGAGLPEALSHQTGSHVHFLQCYWGGDGVTIPGNVKNPEQIVALCYAWVGTVPCRRGMDLELSNAFSSLNGSMVASNYTPKHALAAYLPRKRHRLPLRAPGSEGDTRGAGSAAEPGGAGRRDGGAPRAPGKGLGGGGALSAARPRLVRLAPAGASAPHLLLCLLTPCLLLLSSRSETPNVFHFDVFVGKIAFKGRAAAFGTVCWGLANKCVISNSFILDDPDLKDIDPTVLKHCHAAAAMCILEAGKQKADISAISTCLEDCKLDKERIEQFCTEYQKNKDALEILLGSIGRSPLHITDVSWRLEYQIKNNQLHKTYQPSYLVTLNVESSDSGSHPDVSFSCTMEQLQDLVGKLKDAAKSLERATQM
ncbi:COMM domain-containing protein 3 [Geospiza fortis]|uniref:COMM domain-containing protein 3 n=1 Tax=Geospiza fortis TaxID=48883 RepID=A0A8N5F3A0_GEOFO|nr:COMM domain-containing protein 3 [Geospiza fortis]